MSDVPCHFWALMAGGGGGGGGPVFHVDLEYSGLPISGLPTVPDFPVQSRILKPVPGKG